MVQSDLSLLDQDENVLIGLGSGYNWLRSVLYLGMS